MLISKGSAPIRSIEDWYSHAPPRGKERHWRDGRSAKECARAWFDASSNGTVPIELAALLDSHTELAGARVASITPEHRVYFDQLPGEPRNSDVVGIATHPDGTIAFSVEAKADESFDKLITSILKSAAKSIAVDENTNIVRRIQDLARSLLPTWRKGLPHLGELRYQLLTSVAGALQHALDSKATRALLIVHEFVNPKLSTKKLDANAADFDRFVARLTDGRTTQLQVGVVVGPIQVPADPLFQRQSCPALYIGKARRLVPAPARDE